LCVTTSASLTKNHLLVEGDNMAVSKHIRRTARATNPFFLELFRESKVSAKRERAWRDAVRLVATGDPPLRFPVYNHLYQLNVCAQRMVELLEEFSSKFSINREPTLYRQSLIQYVRAAASHDVVEFMSGIELTEGWLFESQRRKEEDRLRDPDDVYISVRQRETERAEQGLPPRIRFLHKAPIEKTPTAKKAKVRKAK
jgi:hypothetical protein